MIAFRQENLGPVKQTMALRAIDLPFYIGSGCGPCSRFNHPTKLLRVCVQDYGTDQSACSIKKMPTLTRLIIVLVILAGLVYAGMVALVTFVHPIQTEMTIRVPSEKLNPKPQQPK
jgi:hypothetical protein